MTKVPIILIGGGGHCRSCIDVIEQEGRFKILGIVEKKTSKSGKERGSIFDYPVIGSDSDLPLLRERCSHALITIGGIKSQTPRIRIFEQLKKLRFEFPVIKSPLAYISQRSQIGEGSIIMHHSIVNAGACIGSNCILNSKSLIEHDVEIGNNVHLSTGAIINGGSIIGDGSFIGSGAILIQGLNLPAKSFVRAGKLVVAETDYKIYLEN